MADSQPQDRAHRPTRGEFAHFIAVPTRWSDNDSFGHLNNAVYYSFFDTAVTRFLFAAAPPADAPAPMFFVAETGCCYLAEAAYPDILDIGLRISRLGATSVRYDLGVFRQGEDAALALGLFVHVHIDRTTRRPAPLDAPLRAILEGLVR